MAAEQLDFLVHFNRTLCVSLSSSIANVSTLSSFIQAREGVPSDLLDLYVNGRKLDVSAAVPSFPTIIRARLRGGLRGGKGGFGAMLRSMGKASGAKATTDFGACRDLHGRRLRHVNQEVAMLKWRQDAEARNAREKDGVSDREVLDEDTPSGIPGWYLATPSWAEGVKKSYMKRRRNTVLCRNWVKAREGGRSAPEGAPRWWGCPRGRDCDFAHGEEELRGEGLTELKRAKKQEAQRAKQQELQDYVDFEQEMPDDVLDAIKLGLRRRKTKAKAKMELQEEDARVLPPDATTYISVRSAEHPPPVVERWLELVGEENEAHHCCALTKGKWYYEVRLITAGVMQLGWADATFHANSETGDGVGDHERSWAYDGARQVKWNSGKDEVYADDESWSKSDVIGCLLDLDEGTIAFTRNGVNLGVAYGNVKCLSGDKGFFPAISVEQTEILLVNIGSQPLLYQPSGFEPVINALEAKAAAGNIDGLYETVNIETMNSDIVKPEEPVDTQNSSKKGTSRKKKHGEPKAKVMEKEEVATPVEPPIDLLQFETVTSLEALGLERLKLELSRRDLKCGGSLTERANRLFSVRGKAWEDIDDKLKTKKTSQTLEG
ncbi:hypothetical protein PHYBOEH_000851 [Phytophthora boehmeriae]|uniref:Sde2 N-terminal ubiquitin domain-containing protein n=1 Tax=Phytophthora boehmeriae TaxID=109152 RepID=A0A8T1X047_9STRA|nr:hypothetical protein PHYBOEH_000851 [Phytophthora boehmeriae]